MFVAAEFVQMPNKSFANLQRREGLFIKKMYPDLLCNVSCFQISKKSNHDDVNIQPSSFYSKDDSRQYLRNPQADLDTIESIDSVFFATDNDVNLHELEVMF